MFRKIRYWLSREEERRDIILSKRLDELFSYLYSDKDLNMTSASPPEDVLSPGMRWYYIAPRLGVKASTRELLEVVGDRFTIFYAKKYRVVPYIYTSASEESLKKYFEVEEAAPRPFHYAAIAKARRFRSDKHFFELHVRDLPGLASRLPEDTGIAYSVAPDHWLVKLLNSKKATMEKQLARAKYGKDGSVPELYEPIRKKVEKGFVLASFALFADSKDVLEEIIELAKSRISMPVSFEIKKIKNYDEWEFYPLLEPPRISIGRRLLVGLDLSGFLTVTLPTLENMLLLPDPQMHDVSFVRAARVPLRLTQGRSGTIKLGTLEDGKPFVLSPEDLFRHAYVIGQTGTGKTNLLKLLARRLHSLGYPVFVIDPHGELGRELATTVADAIYLHPTESPFGINPLELPPLEDRNQAVRMSLDTLLNLFTNVFKLPETAINVRYILQTVARQIYKIGGTPTLAGIYEIVRNIYNGYDVGIADERFREYEKILRNMPDQSFISTLGRLQGFAEDDVLRKLTSSTTVDLDELVDSNRMVIFCVPQRSVGLEISSLICSTLLLRLYYAALMRSERGEKKDFFVIVDEFQTLQSLPILANILSEARKFGLHLIVAHQFAEQLTEDIFQAAMNNTGVKFVFQITGGDVYRFKSIDPTFGKEIEATAPSLPTGRCIVKITTRPEDAQIPPLVVNVLQDTAAEVRKIEDAIEETRKMGFEPEDIELDLGLVNPVLKYIDLPFPPEQRILRVLYELGGKATANELYGHMFYMRQDAFERILSSMRAKGYIYIRKTTKEGRIVTMTNKFFDEFRKLAPSEKGKDLIELAARYYLSEGYYVAPTKNVDVPRPDLVVIPYKEYYLDYSRAIEVEVEATTAEKEPEHLEDTAKKGTPFKEKHVWCYDEDFPTVVEYLRDCDKEVTIFRVSSDGKVTPLKLEKALEVLEEEKEKKVEQAETRGEEGQPEQLEAGQPEAEQPEAEQAKVGQEPKPERAAQPAAEEEASSTEEEKPSAKAATASKNRLLAMLLKAGNYGISGALARALYKAGVLEKFIEAVEECVKVVDESAKKKIAEVAKTIAENPSKVKDVCSMLALLDEKVSATVAEAVRVNEKLQGREDIVDEMLKLAVSEEGREAILEVARMGLDADTTLRVLRVLKVGGLEYLDAIKMFEDVHEVLALLEEDLGISAPPKGEVEKGAEAAEQEEGDEGGAVPTQPQAVEQKEGEDTPTQPAELSAPSAGTEESEKPEERFKEPSCGKKNLGNIVVGAVGADAEEVMERRKKVTVIGGRRLVVLKGDHQKLRIDAGMSKIYLVDERKTEIRGSILPEEGLMSLREAPPGKYTLLVVDGKEIVRKYLVELLE